MPRHSAEATFNIELGSRLRMAREMKGMTQQQAASAMGMESYTPIWAAESGKGVSVWYLARLSRAYGCSMDVLLPRALVGSPAPRRGRKKAEPEAAKPRRKRKLTGSKPGRKPGRKPATKPTIVPPPQEPALEPQGARIVKFGTGPE